MTVSEQVEAEWHLVGEGTPLECWLETKLEGENETNICLCRITSIGDEPEWCARDGRTTVTHHSFAAPSHWRWPANQITAASSAPSPAPVTEEQIARVVCCPRGCIFADVQGEKCLAMSHNHETRAAVLKLIAPQPPSGEIGCAVVCDASKFDGVICADDECDIANGTRQAPPAKGEQATLPATDDAGLVSRRETSKKLLDIVDRIAALSASRDTAGLVTALEKIAGQTDNNWTRVLARAALASHAAEKSL